MEAVDSSQTGTYLPLPPLSTLMREAAGSTEHYIYIYHTKGRYVILKHYTGVSFQLHALAVFLTRERSPS